MHLAFTGLAVAPIPALLLGLLLTMPVPADAKRLLTGDVDCDGHADTIVHAVSPGRVSVEVRSVKRAVLRSR